MSFMWKKQGKLILAVIAFILVAVMAGAAIATEEKPVVSVEEDKVGEQELIDLIIRQTGIQDQMLPIALSQMSLDQREELVDQVVTALLLSHAAVEEGLEDDEEVALTLKWNRANALAQAYINKISEKWSLKEEELEKFYEENKEDYVVPDSVHVRHILTETEEEAAEVMEEIVEDEASFEAVAEEKSIDPESAEKGGDLGWITKGQTVPVFDELVFSMEENSIEGPVESRFGWHVVQVLEKKPGHQQTFEEALSQVREDIQQSYLAQEVDKLKDRYDVEVDTEALSNLGGFPASE
ncbi:MAG: peptidylprolyl isomerase [Thermovirgaceae bacterium]